MKPEETAALHESLMTALAAERGRAAITAIPGGESLSPAELDRRIGDAADRLLGLRDGTGRSRGLDLGPGDLALLSARNLPSYLVAVAALWKSRLVPLLADADLSGSEIAGLVGAFRPAFALLDREVPPGKGLTEDLGEALPGLRAWVPPARGAARRLQGAAVVRLTSGTTGRPRGLVVTAAQLLADSRQIASTMGIGADDNMVAAIPLGHAYGFVHVLMALVMQGTRSILIERPLPALLEQALSRPGPLVMAGTPYLFELLLHSTGTRRFPGLRLCLSAGAPLPERLSRSFKERFGLPIRTFYGASECGGITFDRSAGGIVPDGCVGTPLDGVGVVVEPEAGLGEGLGRICVRSAAVVGGYLPESVGRGSSDRPAGPSSVLRPGLFMTSDLGRLDEGGRLHLLGRIDRLINVGGRKVDPAEVERVLRRVPGILEAIVFGASDRHRGETVCACVVAARGLRRESILEACRPRLAPFKMPRRIEFVEAIPRTGRGKADRRALAKLIGAPPAPRCG